MPRTGSGNRRNNKKQSAKWREKERAAQSAWRLSNLPSGTSKEELRKQAEKALEEWRDRNEQSAQEKDR
jgi:hypothetical protein